MATAGAPAVAGKRSARDLESRTLEIGRELLAAARGRSSAILSARFWSDQIIEWAMRDPAFKVQLFRFIDVFPTLRTPEQIHDTLVDYVSQPGVSLPPGLATRGSRRAGWPRACSPRR